MNTQTQEAVSQATKAIAELNRSVAAANGNHSYNSPQLCANAQISIAHNLHAIMLMLAEQTHHEN